MGERLTGEQLREWANGEEDGVYPLTAEMANELLALRARVAQLEGALADAIECTEHWAAYASDYFKDKHDYPGDIVRLRAALKEAAVERGGV